MSNINKDVMGDCELGERCGSVRMVLQPRDKDLGGFLFAVHYLQDNLKPLGLGFSLITWDLLPSSGRGD